MSGFLSNTHRSCMMIISSSCAPAWKYFMCSCFISIINLCCLCITAVSELPAHPQQSFFLITTSITATSFLDFVSVWWLQWKLCISRPFMTKWARVWVGSWMKCIVGKGEWCSKILLLLHDGNGQKERDGEERQTLCLSFPSVHHSFQPAYHFWLHKSVKLTVMPATTQHALWICAFNIMTAFHTVPDHYMQYCPVEHQPAILRKSSKSLPLRDVRALKLPSEE